MKAMKRLALLVCGLALVGRVLAEPGLSNDTILLGQSVVLSGPQAENGVRYSEGIRLYLDQVNKSGGVNGRKLELLVLDDGYNPQNAGENARRLIEEKQVFALLGCAGTGPSLAALAVAEKSRVPFIAPMSGADNLRTTIKPVLYNVRAGYRDEMRKIVEHQSTLGMKKIALVYQDDSYGKAALKSFEEAMAVAGLTPVAALAIDPANPVASAAAAAAALGKNSPGAVILGTGGKLSAIAIGEIIKTGVRPQFFGLSVVSAAQLVAELKADATGIVIAQVVPSPWSTKHRIVRQYREALGENAAGANHSSLEGYIAARVVVEGLRRAGKNLTRSGLLSALEGIDQLDIGDYVIGYANGKHAGSAFVELSLIRSNGQFIQ